MTLMEEVLVALRMALQHCGHVTEDTLRERLERAIKKVEKAPKSGRRTQERRGAE